VKTKFHIRENTTVKIGIFHQMNAEKRQTRTFASTHVCRS